LSDRPRARPATEPRSGNHRTPATPGAARGRGGRPSRQQAEQLGEKILEIAAALFLEHGYGATSIELVAKRVRISKRTFYHRFSDKADLFGAVVRRLVVRLRPRDAAQLFEGGTLEEILRRLAAVILHAALTPEALALQRVILAEATRFPELAAVVNEKGARQEAITMISALLEREAHTSGFDLPNPVFAAEQFLQLVVSAPQRRALGLGAPMTPSELEAWAQDSVRLFLNGIRGNADAEAAHD
jgi:AcrR family transcriptional regulator